MTGPSQYSSSLDPRLTFFRRSLAMIKRCIISSSMPEDLRKDLKPSTLLDVISKCKTSEMSPALYRAQQAAMDNPQSAERMEAICRVYE